MLTGELLSVYILNVTDWQNVSPVNLALKMICKINLLVFFGEEFGE